jgi:hypothetical protein
MKIKFYTLLLVLILLPALLEGQIAVRQAGFRLGYRSGIFYQVSSEQGNAEIAYNLMLGYSLPD